ncbi:MAG: archease [Usitatibacter sp.]
MAPPRNGVAYFEHGADVGVIGCGPSVEDAFTDAAHAMFALATDPGAVAARERLEIEFEESDLELALVRWLNLLLAAAAERGLAFRCASLRRAGARWLGEAWGERWHEGLERGTEVKGATLTMLSVKRVGELWEARCVVDV